MFLPGMGAGVVGVRFTILHERLRLTCSNGSSNTISVSLMSSFLELLLFISSEDGAPAAVRSWRLCLKDLDMDLILISLLEDILIVFSIIEV